MVPNINNRVFDRLACTKLAFFGRSFPAFQVCGYTGFFVGLMQSLQLIRAYHLSLLVQFGITGVVILTFYGLVAATKIITGKEQIIYYHHEIAVMAMIALFLRLTHQPLLPFLDIAILGIGLFLSFGRVGCLMVGCCHGRPSKFGPRYKPEHGEEGFPTCLVGVRLFPIQAVESLFVLCVVVLGDALVARGHRPGEALELYTVIYGCGRFIFEFYRGDIDRPYSFGFSQAQWISLLLMGATVWAEFNGELPLYRWHACAVAGLLSTMLLVAISRRFTRTPRHLLISPRHTLEIANALKRIFDQPCSLQPKVCSTSLGVLISGSVMGRQDDQTFHYALSAHHFLPPASARVLADCILRLRHPAVDHCELKSVSFGVYHLLASNGTTSELSPLPAANYNPFYS